MLEDKNVGEQPSQNNEAINNSFDNQSFVMKSFEVNQDISSDNLIVENQTNEKADNNNFGEGSLLGKFKDVNSLSQAYANLQSEFTRKSQRLSQLEKQIAESYEKNENKASENISKSDISDSVNKDSAILGENEDISDINLNKNKSDNNNAVSEIETLPNYLNESWSGQVEEFLINNPTAKGFAKDIAGELLSDKDLSKLPNSLELAYAKVLARQYKPYSELIEDEEFIENNILNNKSITDRVVRNYLNGLNAKISPKLIKDSAGSSFGVMPKDRPKNLEDAKRLVELMLKK